VIGEVTMYRFADASAARRIVRQATTSRPLAWLSARILHRIDRLADLATRGRFTFSRWMPGLPVVMLTTTGARTGQPRTTPVLGIPDGRRPVVIASNFGQQTDPAWCHNLRGTPGLRSRSTVRHASTSPAKLPARNANSSSSGPSR
jgi:deazaflavin-dependent oxidoreductase (nitroreductase family)